MKQIIECVPNFSEGRNPEIIRQIAAVIEQTEGVQLLDVDPGKATNRTVVTFAGEPEAVVEAAFRAIREAAQLIDMAATGEHPRMGATDVCPLVPISGISLEETAQWAKRLAERVGNELQIPVYLYEAAVPAPNVAIGHYPLRRIRSVAAKISRSRNGRPTSVRHSLTAAVAPLSSAPAISW